MGKLHNQRRLRTKRWNPLSLHLSRSGLSPNILIFPINWYFSINYGIFWKNFIEINIIVSQKNIAIFIALPIISIAMDIGNIGIYFRRLGTVWHLQEQFSAFCTAFWYLLDAHQSSKTSLQYHRFAKLLSANVILIMHAHTHCKVSLKLQNTAIVFAQPNIAIIIEIWLAIEITTARW